MSSDLYLVSAREHAPVCQERCLIRLTPALRRERNDGLYRVITYLVAKMLDELIIAVFASIVFACVVFYGVRLQGEWVLFWLVYLTTLSVGIGARRPQRGVPPQPGLACYIIAGEDACCLASIMHLFGPCACSEIRPAASAFLLGHSDENYCPNS